MTRTVAAILALVVLAACGHLPTTGTSPGVVASNGRTQAAASPNRFPGYSIAVWPPGPRPASVYVLSPGNFGGSRVDYYGWDGSFLRSLDLYNGVGDASVDGAYFESGAVGGNDEIWSSTAMTVVGSIDIFGTGLVGKFGRMAFNWAADGDYFCSLQAAQSGFTLLVDDVTGAEQQIPLSVPVDLVPEYGIGAMQVRCSLTSNRAIVWEGDQPERVALFSLPGGQVVSEFSLGSYIPTASSPDARWLLAYNASSTGPNNEVLDTTTGTVDATVDGNFDEFTPDGRNLVGTDSQGYATVYDWRTRTEVWTGPSHLTEVVFSSDPATNKVLLWLSTGNPMQGTVTYDYWVVSGQGYGFRVHPQSCTMASPVRSC